MNFKEWEKGKRKKRTTFYGTKEESRAECKYHIRSLHPILDRASKSHTNKESGS